jgi:hypothetical protein
MGALKSQGQKTLRGEFNADERISHAVQRLNKNSKLNLAKQAKGINNSECKKLMNWKEK